MRSLSSVSSLAAHQAEGEVTGAFLSNGGPVFIPSLGLALAGGSVVGRTSLVARGGQKPPGPGSEPVSSALALNDQRSPSLEPLTFSPLARAEVMV